MVATSSAAILLLFASACRKKVASDPLPEPPRGSSEPVEARRGEGPLSVPQTQVDLPAPQPIPPDAVPEVKGPLADRPSERPSRAPADAARRTPPAPAAPAAPQPEVSTSESTPVVPRLGPLLSDAQREQYARRIQSDLERVNAVVDAIRLQNLSPDQRESFRRVQAFRQQVEQTREQDPALAASIAERARVLAEDLSRNLR